MIQVRLNTQDAKVKAWLRGRAPKVRSALTARIQRITIKLQSYIKDSKLSGQVLKNRTGHLRRSISQDVTAVGDTIRGRVFVPVDAGYGAVHEYGGNFTVREHLRQSKHGARPVRAHSVHFPERSFMRSAFREMTPEIRAEIEAAVREAVE